MRKIVVFSFLLWGLRLPAQELREAHSLVDQTIKAGHFDYRFNRWTALNKSWILSLLGSRDCEAVLESEGRDLRLHYEDGHLSLSLNHKPLRLLKQAQVRSSGREPIQGVEVIWISLPGWVSLQIQIRKTDQGERLLLSVYQPKSEAHVTPVLEAFQN